MRSEDGKRKKRKAKTGMIGQSNSSAINMRKPAVFDMIGKQLRDFYDDIAKQPVPDRFVELLNQLESRAAKKDR
jgi:hypothetical protein